MSAVWGILFLLSMAHGRAGGDNGNVAGNGGGIIVCPDKRTSDIFANGIAIYDVYEGKKTFNLTYKTLASFRSQNFEQAFNSAVSRFLKRDPWRASQIKENFGKRHSQIKMIHEDMGFGDVSWWALWEGCDMRRAAMQYGPRVPSPVVVLNLEISSDIWNGGGQYPGLTTDQKIALLFHEYFMKDYLFVEGTCAYSLIHVLVSYVLSDQGLSDPDPKWREQVSRRCDAANPDLPRSPPSH